MDMDIVTQQLLGLISEPQPPERLLEEDLALIRNARKTRQEKRETVQSEMQRLQQTLQDLDKDDEADSSKETQRKKEHNDARHKWEQKRERTKAILLKAFAVGVCMCSSDLGCDLTSTFSQGPSLVLPHPPPPPPPAPEIHSTNGLEKSPVVPSHNQEDINLPNPTPPTPVQDPTSTSEPDDPEQEQEQEPGHDNVRPRRRTTMTPRAAGSASLLPDSDAPHVCDLDARHVSLPTLLISASQSQPSVGAPNPRRRKHSLTEPDLDNMNPRPGNHTKKARNDVRTIDFDEVYQDGNPDHKHIIIQYPKNSRGGWYILRCDEHSIHFGRHPLAGASKHLNGKGHGHLSKEHSIAVEKLGIRVRNCDADKTETNNAMVNQAFAAGYQPFKAKRVANVFRNHRQSDSPATHPPKLADFEGITEPAVGEVYRTYFPGQGYYAALMLPTGSFEPVGMAGSMSMTGLPACTPKCYLVDKLNPGTYKWADGYEDGGPKVHRRKFPMMSFGKSLVIPRRGTFGIPVGRHFSWVHARDLRPFHINDPECQGIHGFRTAQAFYRRMESIASNVAGLESHRDAGLFSTVLSNLKRAMLTMPCG